MPLRSTASLISRVCVLVLAACGPKQTASEDDSSTGDTAADTTATTTTTASTTTDDPPTPTTTGSTDPTTGTTGDPGQPVHCDGEPGNQPACVETCVLDVDRMSPLLDPSCRAIETRADMTSIELPACVAVMDSWQPPDGAQACFTILIDKDGKQTPSNLDDLSPECIDLGSNAEIVLIRSTPPMPGACVFVTCRPSDNVMLDCPNL